MEDINYITGLFRLYY